MSASFERAETLWASEQIMALVSGFAAAEAQFRGMLMLQAYVDESGNGDPNLLVVAGYIAESNEWARFANAWKNRISEAGIACFKMHKHRSRPEVAGWFYRLIEEFDVKASIACVINTKELREVEASIRYPSNIRPMESINPYFWAFRNIIYMLTQSQENIGILNL